MFLQTWPALNSCKCSKVLKLCSELKMSVEYKYVKFFVVYSSFYSSFRFFGIFSLHPKGHVQPLSAAMAYFMFWKILPERPLKQQMAPFIYDSAKKTISRMFIGQELHWNRECLEDLLHCLLFTVYVAVMPWGHNQNQGSRGRLKEWWSCLQFESIHITLSFYVLSPLSSRTLVYPSNNFLFKNLLPLSSYFHLCLAAVLRPLVTPVKGCLKWMFHDFSF